MTKHTGDFSEPGLTNWSVFRFVLTKGLAKLRYDGTMGCGKELLAQFTELDKASPSYGASFYLPSDEATPERIENRRAEKRVQFAVGAFKLGALALMFACMLDSAHAQQPYDTYAGNSGLVTTVQKEQAQQERQSAEAVSRYVDRRSLG